MPFRTLFSHSVPYIRTVAVPAEKGAAEAAGAGATREEVATGTVGSLVSPDSLATFAGGSAAITVIWGGIERLSAWSHSLWVGAIISLVIGALLLWSDLSDPARTPRPTVPMRILAAIVNTFILWNAAAGALTTSGVSGHP